MYFGDRGHRKLCKRWDIPWDAHCLTFSCFHRLPFLDGKNSPLWFLEALDAARKLSPFDLWAYVIMPEHVHLLILPHENVTISCILKDIKQPVTRQAVKWAQKNCPSFLPKMAECRPSGKTTYRFWQPGGGYDRNMRSVRDIHEKIAYIHGNPVRRGLVQTPGDWPWSSWRAWEQNIDEPISIDRDSLPQLES